MNEIDCRYCGKLGLEKYGFCSKCWNRLCGERQEMIVLVGGEHGYDCEHFQHVVAAGIAFLKWLDERQAPPPQPPEYDPNKESDDDWWKK